MFDLKEEQQYAELKKLAKKLHIPIPEAFLTLEVFDKNGKLIQRHRQRSHSWVRNAYNAIFQCLSGQMAKDQTFGAGLLSMKNDVGSIKPLLGEDYFVAFGADAFGHTGCSTETERKNTMLAAAAFDGCGIQVGSGSNVESFEHFALQTQIVEGTGAGELNHVASEPHAITYADTTLTDTLIRYFNNNTVGETSVDVNEVALMAHIIYHSGAGDAGHFLLSRDVLASTVTVPSTGQLKVTYTVQLTYPS